MLVQALVILGSMLTALSISIDAGFYLLHRYQLQHALFDTVRLHTRTHMRPSAFAQELKEQIERLHLAQPLGWPHSWYAEQLSPSDEDFELFRDPVLEKRLQWPYPAINNNYQAHQFWQHNDAPISGKNIFTANTLELLFYYAYRPYNPIVRALLKGFYSWAKHSYTRGLLEEGLLPIKIHITHPYASHPIAWPAQTDLPYFRHTGALQPTAPRESPMASLRPPTASHSNKLSTVDTSSRDDALTPFPSPSAPSQVPPTQLDKDDLENNWGAPPQDLWPDSALNCDHPACCSVLP